MIKNIYVTCAFFLFVCLGAYAQTGAIKGKIIDKATKEPIPFATVVAESEGQQKGGAQSDFDGVFTIKPLQAGKYTVKVKFIGYNDIVVNDVLVSVDKNTFQDLALSKQAVDLKPVEVIEYKVPLIDKGNVSTGGTITREEIEAAPTRDVRSVAATTAGVLQQDEGDDVNVRGSRADATDYYIDGVRVRYNANSPVRVAQAGVDQVTVVTGGLPAQYGDATGGVISITTRGPSQQFAGGVEYVTSELFDKYGYNLASINLSGPILGKKQSDGSKRTLLGFFVSGELQLDKDPNPSAIKLHRLKSDLYEDLKTHPIVPSFNDPTATGAGAYGFTSKPEYYHADAFEESKVRNNVAQKGYRFTAKFDYQPIANTTFTFGGNYDYNGRKSFDADFDPNFYLRRSMYNFEENPLITESNYRLFARVTQKVGSTFSSGSEESKSASLIKNVYISLQGEFTKSQVISQDPELKDNLTAYGYVGKFDNNRTRRYRQDAGDTLRQTGYNNSFSFTPSDENPYTANYTSTAAQYFTSFYQSSILNGVYTPTQLATYGLTGENSVNDLSVYQGAGGLRNGDAPSTVWSMWDNIGNPRNTYRNDNSESYRITLSGNADIKNHAISLGFEFEQVTDKSYLIGPRGIWTLARQLSNSNFIAIDNSRDSSFTQGSNGETYVNYQSGYSPSTLEGETVDGFYEKIRRSLGVSNYDYVNIDALTPDQLSLSFFNADELVINNYVTWYYGYDYTGKKFSGNPTFKDFFTKKQNGIYTREIGAFQPVYMAGYIQDKFAIDNLNFNIGVRVDRFDANQKQLKDKYLMSEAYTVGNLPGGIQNKPDNIGDGYVPYLATEGDYTSIIGYRNGDVWYDKEGRIVSNPDFIASQSTSGRIFAAAVNDNAANIFATKDWEIDKVFEDYKPQYSIMPRVAFSFPISDQALFFAHYDVLTQRPASNLRLDPLDFLILQQSAPIVNNGALKPEKTTDYEIGFKQTLSKSSALTISAFYREMKNNVQLRNLGFAYPYGYTTYDNIDFGTVKGLSLTYDMRRTGNLRLSASYTLQFADGTGSGANDNLELTQTNQPDIRIIFPLNFDQRHNFVASVDYRYEDGSNYNGPILFGKQFFANVGANFTFKVNSGTPYTSQARPTPEANAIGWQSNGQRSVEGGLNGARNPWQFRADLKINKTIEVKVGSKKTADIEVYLQIQNLFNTKNVVNVYRVTGNPDDDGYIQSLEGQQYANAQTDPQAFIDQYNIKVLNPNNYSIPRRTRIGIAFNF